VSGAGDVLARVSDRSRMAADAPLARRRSRGRGPERCEGRRQPAHYGVGAGTGPTSAGFGWEESLALHFISGCEPFGASVLVIALSSFSPYFSTASRYRFSPYSVVLGSSANPMMSGQADWLNAVQPSGEKFQAHWQESAEAFFPQSSMNAQRGDDEIAHVQSA